MPGRERTVRLQLLAYSTIGRIHPPPPRTARVSKVFNRDFGSRHQKKAESPLDGRTVENRRLMKRSTRRRESVGYPRAAKLLNPQIDAR